MTVLVTGGAGYIGSHMVLRLLDAGERVVVLDDLSTGRRALVDPRAQFVCGNAGDDGLVENLLEAERIDEIIHFAGSIVVPESVCQPLDYYRNNTVNSRTLIACAVKAGVRAFIFSSTAAVYGSPAEVPVAETAALMPINPYGRSKLMTEWMLEDAGKAHGLPYVALRYFNVAGADPQGRTGQVSPKATHLIKVACEVATGQRAHLEIFGSDYLTPDGTCIRDYIHVSDLIEAHMAALAHLRQGGASGAYNCGYGRGFSVLEVVAALERELGHALPAVRAARRPGDAASLVADPTRLRSALNWRARYDDLDFIVRTALAWERRLLSGSRR